MILASLFVANLHLLVVIKSRFFSINYPDSLCAYYNGINILLQNI